MSQKLLFAFHQNPLMVKCLRPSDPKKSAPSRHHRTRNTLGSSKKSDEPIEEAPVPKNLIPGPSQLPKEDHEPPAYMPLREKEIPNQYSTSGSIA
jgi:hypothetical protein